MIWLARTTIISVDCFSMGLDDRGAPVGWDVSLTASEGKTFAGDLEVFEYDGAFG